MSKRYFNYEIAVKFGRDESDILCTIYSWLHTYAKSPLKYRENFRDGFWWSYNSVQKWHEQFEYIGLTAFKKKLSRLREHGYLVKSEKEYNKRYRGKNSTSWFTLDLERIHKDFPTTVKDMPFLPIPNNADMVANRPTSKSDSDQQLDGFRPTGRSHSDQTIPYTFTDNKDNNNTLLPYSDRNTDDEQQSTIGKADRGKGFINSDKKRNGSPLDMAQKIFKTDEYYSHVSLGRRTLFLNFLGKYFEAYEKYRGQVHPNVSEKQMLKALDNIRICSAHEHPEIIPLYFQSEFKKGCDYRLSHFTSLGVLRARLKELANGTKANDTLSENIIDDEWCEYGECEEPLPFD